MRHSPNFRYTARGRPQSMHRCTFRVENFAGRFAEAILDLLAIGDSNESRDHGWTLIRFIPPRLPCVPDGTPKTASCRYAAAPPSSSFFRGTPIARRNCRASSSLRAVVTSVMFIPWGRVYLSGLISGKTICSDSPRL